VPGGIGDILLSSTVASFSGQFFYVISLAAFTGAALESYAASMPWTLAQTSGLATVYVKYMDAGGNISD